MRDLQVTTQATIEVIATVDKYQLKSFGFDQEAKFVLINWEKGAMVDGSFAETTDHKTKITNTAVTTDGTTIAPPSSNPYNTISSKVNSGDFTPESTLIDYLEYVLATYAGI